MRFHINDAEKVGQCKARPGYCPFKSADGKEMPHYSTREEATIALTKKLEKQYPNTMTTRKTRRAIPKKFLESQKNIKELLVEMNIKKADELTQVETVKEMVDKWFDGNRANYTTFRDLAKTDLTTRSKESISKMFNDNITVNIANNSNLDTKPNSRFSNIDLLDDTFDKITIEDFKKIKF